MSLWIQIIHQKISNQSKALSIMGREGADIVAEYVGNLDAWNVEYNESLAAKEYFLFYHEGLNRRTDDPVNSRLNYGYEVFMRIVQNRKAAEKHYRRIQEVAPKTGTVRLLRLTEKQYENISFIMYELDYQEKTVGTNGRIMI